MKNRNRPLAHGICGFALAAIIGAPVWADDTEILVGAQLNPGEPNLLFIIDTSGSMDSEVVVGEGYDPAVTYQGNCSIDRVYWNQDSGGTIRLPDCRFDAWVNKAAVRCNASVEPLASVGQFRDRFAQWNVSLEPYFWSNITRANAGGDVPGRDRLTECRSDFGVHGDEDPSLLYPTDGANGPWSNNEGDAIAWDATGDFYTFFDANYLNWIQETGQATTVSTRMQVVKDVSRDVLTPITGVNVSLMRFSTNAEGGMVLQAMTPIVQGRTTLLDTVDALVPDGSTPLAETLYEAGQYFAGRSVDFGLASTDSSGAVQPSVAASHDANGNYISPITLRCQRSYVVVLTDGLPTGDTDGNARIQGLPGFSDTIGACDGNCLDEMAKYLDQVDQRSGTEFADKQSVQTFTIGFHTDQQLLEDAATGVVPILDNEGNPTFDNNGIAITRPGYFVADDQDELAAAFEDIIATIQTDGESFTSPSLSVNVQNRLTNREDVYFAMFQPATRGEPHWDGNLKKYRVGRPAGAGADTVPTIVDANLRAAVDSSGVFVSGAQSYWSLAPDEGSVVDGGFLETLTTSRNVYSDISSGILTAAGNHLHESNTALTATMLNVDPTERDDLVRWARGLEPDGSARKVVGDALHSQPVVLAYDNDRFGLFFGTNDGFLHAIDPESTARGVRDIEHFAFIPKDLLPQLNPLKRNLPQQQFRAVKNYGLDGPLTLWIDETDNDRVVESGERAFLYVGMRRGGRNYYALDVTDIDRPKLVWTIRGGTGDFVELGETWSAPIPGKIRVNGSKRDVLFFAGGNDSNQDAHNRPGTADDRGRAIYIVDAVTGQRLWWASVQNAADLTLAEMTHSIPSDLRVVDTDQDGLDDRIYVGDTTAQLWRFDIDNSSETITGTVFASLGSGGESGNRRFYYPPSVTRIIDEEVGTFLTVSIGTGHRAHPLESDVEDMFFMVRDPNPFAPTTDINTGLVAYPDPVERSDLRNVTNNASPSASDLSSRQGWYIEFASGEKNLSAPLSVLNQIFFTTYIPTPPPPSCQPVSVIGNGRLYSVDILSGAPVNYADTPTVDDRYTDLGRDGIPPSPTLVFTEPPCDACEPGDQPVSEITMLVATEAIDPNIDNRPRRTYWVQEDIDR